MLDESIFSSPEKENSSIHKARIQRKKKQKHTHSVPSPLRSLYDEPDSMEEQESFEAFNQQTDFDVFGDQLILTQADRLEYSKTKESNNTKVRSHLQSSQGFSKCEHFLQPTDTRKPKIKEMFVNTDAIANSDGAHVDIEISDSELLYFCEEVEKQISNAEHNCRTEKKNMPPKQETNSIVDSIIKDFCSSPSSPDTQIHLSTSRQQNSPIFIVQNNPSRTYNQRSVSMRLDFAVQNPTGIDESAAVSSATVSSEDDNPRFIFNKTPLRTYSRQSVASTRVNFADLSKRLTFDNDCLSDSSSVLSVQEDQTHELNDLEVNRVHHSQQVCENIQNLSAFFTQNSQNSEECFGKATISAKEETKSLLSFSEKMEQTIIELHNVNRCSSHPNEFPVTTKSNSEVNRTEPDIPNASVIVTNGELKENIFDESDNKWNSESNNFFKHIKIQDVFVPKNSNAKEDVVEIPEAIIQQTVKQAKLLEMPQNNKKEFQELHSEENFNFYLGFQIASQKNISLSKVIEQDFPELLKTSQNNIKKECEDLPKNEHKITRINEKEIPSILQNHFTSEQCRPSSSKTKLQLAAQIQIRESANFDCASPNLQTVTGSMKNTEFVGFLTASKKSINISEASKRKAASILTDLPEIPQKREKYEMPRLNSQENYLNITKGRDAPKLRTQLSTNARLNENNGCIMHANTEVIPESLENRELVGFLTASKKSIKISEAAKKKAANILTNLPEIPQKCEKYQIRLGSQENNLNNTKQKEVHKLSTQVSGETKLNAIHKNAGVIPDDIVLSEWFFEEDPKMLEEIKLESLHHEVNETKTTDICSKDMLQNYSINHSEDDALRLTERNLSLDSPRSSRSTKRAATRRNLLSLSRTKKIKPETVSALDTALYTPIKKQNFLTNKTDPDAQQVPSTPNLKEFFSMATNTSTPARLNEMNKSKEMKTSNIDIEFNATSKASSTSNLSDISCENITLKHLSVNDKLHAISPNGKPNSSTLSNCRVSGLRRRSNRNIKK